MNLPSFNSLIKNLKKDSSNFSKIKIALLGDSSTQFLAKAIKGMAYEFKYNVQLFESDFNQVELQVFDANSELYSFQPEIIFLFQSSHKLLQKYNKGSVFEKENLCEEQIKQLERLCDALQQKTNSKIIYFNYSEINDFVFGNYANSMAHSFLFQVRKLNFELMEFSKKNANFFICDLSSIQNKMGKDVLFHPAIYINSEMVLSTEALPLVSYSVLQIINSLKGKLVKCVVLDLDNTTWGGIIGDDGVENIQIGNLGIGKAFVEFQYYIKKLKERGIIICVCSKNNEHTAKEPFISHPEMVLKLDDISVFVANWESKADNIKYIQSVLNIGLDAMVFLDDNPFERNLIRDVLPQVIVPELPEDPALYLEYLYELNLFETVSFSNEDIERTKLYQTEAKRVILQKSFTSENDYLKSLEMISVVEPFNKFNTPRVAQLSQRSNQFNLRTVRYTENEITTISNSKKHFSFTFTLLDKFGDNGLIAVVILEALNETELFIDTWFMSCRVLKRGMEEFVLNTLVTFAIENNYKIIRGEYIPTAKNEMVKNHYSSLGFNAANDDNKWVLEISKYEPKINYIQKK